MYIIAGLGNPGKDYQNTRHNVGFEAVELLADKYHISIDTKKHKGLIGKGVIEGQKVILVKPQTYMNLSGECIREVMDYYKVSPEELLVIYDDVTLDVGRLRIRKKGSAGGHNGIKSIISHVGTDAFPRIRIGVGNKPPRMDLADYVLGHFAGEDKENIKEGYEAAAAAAPLMITDRVDEAMNQFNAKKKQE